MGRQTKRRREKGWEGEREGGPEEGGRKGQREGGRGERRGGKSMIAYLSVPLTS